VRCFEVTRLDILFLLFPGKPLWMWLLALAPAALPEAAPR